MGRIWMPGGGGGANLDAVTAGAGDVLAGKVIVGPDGEPLTGTMTNRGAWNSSGLAAGAAVTIPAGYHNGGGKVTAKDLASQTPGDATAAQIWTGKKAWVGGRQITGTLATQGGSTTIPGTAAKTIVTPNKIVTGNIAVAGDANLVAGNIKKNVTIFGVKGNCEGWFPTATDLYLRGNNVAGFKLSGSRNNVKFESGAIYFYGTSGSADYIFTTNPYNLSSYNYINVQVNLLVTDVTFRIGYYDGSYLQTLFESESNSVGEVTKSANITSINMSRQVAVYISKIGASSRLNIAQVFRIWLS